MGRDHIARGCAKQGVQLLLYPFPFYGHHGRSWVRLHTSPVGAWWSNPAKRLSPSCSANPALAAFTPSCEVSPNLSPSRPTPALPSEIGSRYARYGGRRTFPFNGSSKKNPDIACVGTLIGSSLAGEESV